MGQQLLRLTTFREMPKHANAVETITRLKIQHHSRKQLKEQEITFLRRQEEKSADS